MSTNILTLEMWLDALASKEPAPGGGAAAALCGAIGAALVSMVANFTTGRPKFAAVEEQVTAILSKGEELRARLTRLIDEDEQAYQAVAAAYRLAKKTGEEREKRTVALHQALKLATDVPLAIAETARDVGKLSLTIAQIGNPAVITDAGAAAIFAKAAADAVVLNVIVNLKVLNPSSGSDVVYDHIQQLRDDMDMIVTETMTLMPALFDEK